MAGRGWLLTRTRLREAEIAPDRAGDHGTAFTQGGLNTGGTPATGSYDFHFRLASDPLGDFYVGPTRLSNAVHSAFPIPHSVAARDGTSILEQKPRF